MTNEELLNKHFKNDNDVKRMVHENPNPKVQILSSLWYSNKAQSMNESQKINWIKRESTKLSGEQIKNQFFKFGNFTIKQMNPIQLKRLWYRGSDDETPEQKVLRIRTHVASNEIKKEKTEKLKEYQGLYFRELYYKDLLVLSKLPYFYWRDLTDNLKRNIRKSENNAKSRNQRYYSQKMQKVNTNVKMNADSTRRIEHLRIKMNFVIFKDLKSLKFRNTTYASKNVSLYEIFSDLELIKKLKTVKLMDQETSEKYHAFLNHVASYRYFIERRFFQ